MEGVSEIRIQIYILYTYIVYCSLYIIVVVFDNMSCDIFYLKPVVAIGLDSVTLSVYLSVSLSVTLVFQTFLGHAFTCFPDFSWLCFHISEWNWVGCLKTYRPSSTFVTVNLLFHELLPFVMKLFSGLFLALLSHISMRVGSKHPYEE